MGYPFSESARVGNLLFLAGQIGEDADGKLVPGGIQAEAEQMMLNIDAALARRGLTMENVVKCTVFLADIAETLRNACWCKAELNQRIHGRYGVSLRASQNYGRCR
jgi:enamine deaminase RidA (YjgF/YER057c/UK114 family)